MIFITSVPFKNFYLSAVTPYGLVSRTEQLLLSDEFSKVILLKGGTPELRSELLKQTANEAKNRGFDVKTAISAVDDELFEAVFWGGTAVADGSFPFNIEPPFIGCKLRPLWLGNAVSWEEAAQKREELSALWDQYKQNFEAARRLLFAADCLLSDNRRTAFAAADEQKLKREAAKTADKFICGKGEERFFITTGRCGKNGMTNSLSGYEVTAFKDRYGSCAEEFLSVIYKQAKRQKCYFYAGFSPLCPYTLPELLLFPQSGRAIYHAEGHFKLSRKPDRVITADRFCQKGRLLSRKGQLNANKKAAQQLLTRSEELFLQATATRNEISRVGGEAADGQLLWQLRRRLLDLIF